jgi:hypothetical protein
MVDVDQNYIEKNWGDLFIDSGIKFSDELSYGRIVSFLKPNSNGSLDTFTVTTSLNSKLFMKEDKFIFIGGGMNEACLIKTENLDLAENRDTIFLNYGKSKLMDYIPYQEIPPINTSLLKKTLSVIDSKRNFVLSDTIISSYTFEAKNFLDGIKFEEYYFFVEYTVDYYCAEGKFIMYPEPSKKQKMYYLKNTGEISLPKDTTINWTLVYTDQYGRSDSLEMKTLFK